MAMRWVALRLGHLAGRQNHQLQSFSALSSFSDSMSGLVSSRPVDSSSSSPDSAISFDLCGRGDKKTKRGKRFKGSFGNARPKMKKKIERIKDKLEVPRSTPWPLPFKLI
ncbi:30S ribosomal protein S31 [Wolffia australiana]